MTPHPKSPDLADKHVGARVKMRRIMLGMSQKALGEGWTAGSEVRKRNEPRRRRSPFQIADILSVPRSFFFDGGPPISDRIKGAPYAPYVDDFLASGSNLTLGTRV